MSLIPPQAEVHAATEVINIAPNSAGDLTNISVVVPTGDHYSAVATDDSDTSYVADSQAAYTVDLYNLADVTDPAITDSAIDSVTVSAVSRVQATNKPTPSLYFVIKLSGTQSDTSAAATTVTLLTYSTYTSTAFSRPGGGSWTWTDINNLQAGIALRDCTSNTTGKSTYCTQVYVTVQYTTPEIANTGNSYNFGTIAESGSLETGLTNFTVTNSSAYAINISISGTDMTGGSTWTLSDTATPDSMVYGLMAGTEGGSYSVIVKKSAPYNVLVTGLGAGQTKNWGLQILAPTIFTEGAAKTGTVTLTASMQ